MALADGVHFLAGVVGVELDLVVSVVVVTEGVDFLSRVVVVMSFFDVVVVLLFDIIVVVVMLFAVGVVALLPGLLLDDCIVIVVLRIFTGVVVDRWQLLGDGVVAVELNVVVVLSDVLHFLCDAVVVELNLIPGDADVVVSYPRS